MTVRFILYHNEKEVKVKVLPLCLLDSKAKEVQYIHISVVLKAQIKKHKHTHMIGNHQSELLCNFNSVTYNDKVSQLGAGSNFLGSIYQPCKKKHDKIFLSGQNILCDCVNHMDYSLPED